MYRRKKIQHIQKKKLLSLPGLKFLKLDGNPFLNSAPIYIQPTNWKEVLHYFLQLNLTEKIRCYRAKVLVLGQEGVGKTTIVSSIKEKSAIKRTTAYFRTKLHNMILQRNITDGIEISEAILEDKKSNREIFCSLWDFAGQTTYYPTHQFYVDSRAVYMIVFDLSETSSCERVTYWINVLQSKVNNPVILIVGTHRDKNAKWEAVLESVKNENVNKRVKIAGTVGIISGSHTSIAQLKEQLVIAIQKSKTFVGQLIPRAFLTLEAMLREEQKMRLHPVISYSEFNKIALSCCILRNF